MLEASQQVAPPSSASTMWAWGGGRGRVESDDTHSYGGAILADATSSYNAKIGVACKKGDTDTEV